LFFGKKSFSASYAREAPFAFPVSLFKTEFSQAQNNIIFSLLLAVEGGNLIILAHADVVTSYSN